jgi:hypothetical protein
VIGECRRLRADGKREEAAALKKRRKPTVPAWAVDQLARRHVDQIDALIGAGDRLRAAQLGVGGGDSSSVRDAAAEFRSIVAELRRQAEAVITDAGSVPPTHLDDVERTLSTAAADPEHHDTLRRGIFERPLPASGFDAAGGLDLPTASASKPHDEPAATEREERRQRRERRQRLEQDRRNLESARDRQQRTTERAQDEAERRRERADRAAGEANNEARTLQRMDAELSAVKEELEQLSSGP